MAAYDKDRVPNLSNRAEKIRRRLTTFVAKLADGDIDGLKQLLTEDVVLVSDGGGEVNALAEPVYGREKVLRLVAKLYQAQRSVTCTSLAVLNGEPAILIERSKVKSGHASFFTMHCELDQNSHLRRLHYVFAPSKLSALKQPRTA